MSMRLVCGYVFDDYGPGEAKIANASIATADAMAVTTILELAWNELALIRGSTTRGAT